MVAIVIHLVIHSVGFSLFAFGNIGGIIIVVEPVLNGVIGARARYAACYQLLLFVVIIQIFRRYRHRQLLRGNGEGGRSVDGVVSVGIISNSHRCRASILIVRIGNRILRRRNFVAAIFYRHGWRLRIAVIDITCLAQRDGWIRHLFGIDGECLSAVDDIVTTIYIRDSHSSSSRIRIVRIGSRILRRRNYIIAIFYRHGWRLRIAVIDITCLAQRDGWIRHLFGIDGECLSAVDDIVTTIFIRDSHSSSSRIYMIRIADIVKIRIYRCITIFHRH